MPNRNSRRVASIAIAVAVAVVTLLAYLGDEPSVGTAADEARTPRAQRDDVEVSPRVLAPAIATIPSVEATASVDAGGVPVQVGVHAPAAVGVGETFEARVQVEAPGGVRRLLLAIRFDKKRLRLVDASEGDFARRGPPAEFSVDEPSDGNVQISLVVRDDVWVAGAGSASVLRFEAIAPGTTMIEARDFSVVDSGARRSAVTVLHNATIAVR
jgi:hypothetical protein